MPDLLAGTTVRALDTPESVTDVETGDETGVTSTTYTDGGTITGVSFTAPTSGRVLVLWTARTEHNSTGFIFVSVSVSTGSVLGSGTEVSAPSDGESVSSNTGAGGGDTRVAAGCHRLVTGLTPGSVYNAITQHRVTLGNGDIFDRSITVIPVP